jgi:citrate lyase beta subunit
LKRDISPFHLGASLYIPAVHKDIFKVTTQSKYPNLKSAIICLEDSILDSQVEKGERNLKEILIKIPEQKLLLFVRPRNIEQLEKILEFPEIEKLDGFILPKVEMGNLERYRKLFTEEFYFMPTLETAVVFDEVELWKILEFLKEFQNHILSIRVGSEDIGKSLRLKRGCEKSIHEIPIFSRAITNVVGIFKPEGFNISAPVFSCYKNLGTLKREVEGDLENGLFGKSVIHPKQIDVVEQVYKISEDDLSEAQAILKENLAVEGFKEKMLEKKTHSNWAEDIILRNSIFGGKRW